MKACFISAIALLICPFFSIAQSPDFSINWSEERKIGDWIPRQIIGETNTSFIIEYTAPISFLASSHTKFKDLKFEKINKETFEVEHVYNLKEFRYQKGREIVLKSVYANSKIHVFLEVWTVSSSVKVVHIALNEDGTHSKPKELTVDSDKNILYRKRIVNMSNSRTKMLAFQSGQNKGKDQHGFGYVIFDTETEKIQKVSSKSLPYLKKYSSIKKAKIANNGDLYFIVSKEPNKKKGEKKIKDAPNEKYLLFRIKSGSKKLEKIDLELDSKFICSINLTLDSDSLGNMIVGGVYGDKDVYDSNGSFFIRINQASLEIEVSEFTPHRNYLSMAQARKIDAESKREVYHLKMDRIIPRSDGGALFVMEQSWRTASKSSTLYSSRSLIILEIGPEGSPEWCSVVPKKQLEDDYIGGRPETVSHLSIVYKEGLYVVYHDDNDNIARGKEGKAPKEWNAGKASGMLTIGNIAADGTTIFEHLGPSEDGNCMFVPWQSAQLNANETILSLSDKGYVKFGHIKIQDKN